MSLKYNWKQVKEYKEILFHKYEGIARISINRPKVHNAFTPLTIQEILDAMNLCREGHGSRCYHLNRRRRKSILQWWRSKCTRARRLCRNGYSFPG
jgi:hypothetical protein